jgi:hypothetical protein
VATFDQLPADQRAIIELVLKRGRSYDALSDMLGMPEARVRELAREALTHLAPVTAGRVDPEWRDQVADYVLGQQTGPESAATKGHLRRSEAARAWLTSLIDSLDQLYANGSRPELPELDGERPRAREKRERNLAVVPDQPKEEAKPDKPEAKKPATKPARRIEFSRTLVGGVIVALAAVVLVLILTGVIGGSDDGGGGKKTTSTSAGNPGSDTTAANAQAKVLGELELKPTALAGKDSVGVVQIVQNGQKTQVAIRAKLPPLKADHAYQVWLYNSKTDVVSLGARRADAQGNFTGVADLPKDFGRFKFLDISDEPIKNDEVHSGKSMLRGAFADLVTPQELQQQQQQQGTTSTAP